MKYKDADRAVYAVHTLPSNLEWGPGNCGGADNLSGYICQLNPNTGKALPIMVMIVGDADGVYTLEQNKTVARQPTVGVEPLLDSDDDTLVAFFAERLQPHLGMFCITSAPLSC